MANESTVLVVSSGTLPEALVRQLEEAGVFVETTTPSEVSQVFTVIGPDLVVHFGTRLWEEVATFVAAGPDPRRVRVVVVVARDAMMEVRKSNRAVVASVLSDDMPLKTLVERIVLLAQKSAHQAKTGERGGSSLIPLASLGPLPPLEDSNRPPALKSPTPAAPALPAAASAAVPPPRLPPPRLGAPRPAEAKPAEAKPAETKPIEAKLAEPLAARAGVAAEAKSPLAAVKPAPDSTKTGAPPLSATRRLALVDDDVTRGDALATALRGLGYQVQLYPTDPARTRWAVLRKFGPELIVTDGGTPQQTVWLELVRADAHLRSAELITAPYRKIYDELNGSLELGPLLARLEGLEVPSSSDRDSSLDRPTSIQPEPEKSAHFAVTATNRTSPFHGGLGDADEQEVTTATVIDGPLLELASRAKNESTPTDDVLDFAGLAAHAKDAPSTHAPLQVSAETTSDSGISAAGVSVTESARAPRKEKRGGGAVVAAALVVAALAGGGYLYSRRGTTAAAPASRGVSAAAKPAQPVVPSPAPGPAAGTTAAPAGPAAAGETTTAADAATGDAAPTAASDGEPWNGADNSEPDCETLVPDQSDLRKGDVAQSGLFWDKARSSLVLGDFKTAQAHLCRAVFVYGQSLAVEALAESYMNLHAPSQAQKWIDVATGLRPGRPKTLELRGDIEAQLGKIDQAKKSWAEALSVGEGDQKTLDAVAKQLVFDGATALKANNLMRAETVLRRAAGLSPTNREAAETLARVYEAEGDAARSSAWKAEAARR